MQFVALGSNIDRQLMTTTAGMTTIGIGMMSNLYKGLLHIEKTLLKLIANIHFVHNTT
jgi:hypothetical protein